MHLIPGIPNEGKYFLAAWKEALKAPALPFGSPGSLAAVLEGAGVVSCNTYIVVAGSACNRTVPSALWDSFPSLCKGMSALGPDKFVMVSSKIALGCPTWELAGLVHGKILTPISVCLE